MEIDELLGRNFDWNGMTCSYERKMLSLWSLDSHSTNRKLADTPHIAIWNFLACVCVWILCRVSVPSGILLDPNIQCKGHIHVKASITINN